MDIDVEVAVAVSVVAADAESLRKKKGRFHKNLLEKRQVLS